MPVSFLTAFYYLLSVWCYLHSGPLLVGQSPQSSKNPVQALIDLGKHLRDSGDLSGAIAKFSEAQAVAHKRQDADYEAKSLILLGSAQTLNFQYQSALNSLELAIRMGWKDPMLAGLASGNKANLYQQLGDFAAAEGQAELAIRKLREVKEPNDFAIAGLSRALLIHATVSFELGKNSQGYSDCRDAIKIAETNNNIPLQAMIWNEQGLALMREHKLAQANEAFQAAVALSTQKDSNGLLSVEKEHLAELELQKPNPDCQAALRLINEAFSLNSPAFKSNPQYYPINIRARILLQDHKKTLALSEFLRAVHAADQWRLGALPGDTTNTQTVAELQEVYADYAQLAAETALETHDKALAVNALDVLSENRAASLREQLRVVYGNNGTLPEEYYGKLAELQTAQAAVTLGGNTSVDQAKLLKIRLDISNLENRIGIKSEKVSAMGERIPRRNSLRDIQHTLGRDQVLISITLGKRRSYLWSVTAGGVDLTGLPGEEELTSKAESFASAIRLGHDAASPRKALTQALFGNLPADVWNRSEWMIVADGPLLNGIPFCALSNLAAGHEGQLLIEDKALRLLPSERLLTERHPSSLPKSFVGIGDPIYNQADPRLAQSRPSDAKSKAMPEGVMLTRLVASGQEVIAAAKETQATEAVLLTGGKATHQDLAAALAHPSGILHFAVHVVSPPDRPQEAALALSLHHNVPELLTPEAIASFHVPGSLVVLSGCSSGLGKVVPGAGLQGLSRAWLLAGAAAVVVSNWPTPDDSGKFFSSFYFHFDQIRSGDTAQRAALALRQTQLDMLHGSGYKTSPQFWGAFAVIAKE